MQNTRAKISAYFMMFTAAASCVLRFFQLTNYTDSETGNIVDGSNWAFYIYAAALLLLVCTGAYAALKGCRDYKVNLDAAGKREFRASTLLSITFFFDFVFQIYTGYSYFTNASYVDYIYFVPLAISAVFALLSCFYFAVFSMTARGKNYDFKNLLWFHFAPVLWGISRLIIIMVKIVDVCENVEIVLEFIFLVLLLVFLFCYIYMLDNGGKISKLFIFSAYSVFGLSVVMEVPRLLAAVSGKVDVILNAPYMGLNYIALGIFAVCLLKGAEKTADD